jgi:hypothetical protein
MMLDTEIRALVDRQGLIDKRFDEEVLFDIGPLTGEGPTKIPPNEIANLWEAALRPLKAVHHQMGNLLVTISDDRAMATCHATATHYLPGEGDGDTRTSFGTYEIGLVRTIRGWRIDYFRYLSKFVTGNLKLGEAPRHVIARYTEVRQEY